MFGGKKEVTEREIQKYLEKDRPEYSRERTKSSMMKNKYDYSDHSGRKTRKREIFR